MLHRISRPVLLPMLSCLGCRASRQARWQRKHLLLLLLHSLKLRLIVLVSSRIVGVSIVLLVCGVDEGKKTSSHA